MSVSKDLLDVIYLPTPPAEVKQRQGHKQHQGDCNKVYGVCQQPHAMLDYIDARYVMDRLDQLGPENWQDVYVQQGPGIVECRIGIKVDDEWVWKSDVGTASDIEPEKGAYSDAFKRAAVKWGIGRDLYDHAPSRPQAGFISPDTRRAGAARRAAPTPLPPPESIVEDDVPPDVWAGAVDRAQRIAEEADGDTCREHGVEWRGDPGDRYHRLADGHGYCRNAPGNVPKRRSA